MRRFAIVAVAVSSLIGCRDVSQIVVPEPAMMTAPGSAAVSAASSLSYPDFSSLEGLNVLGSAIQTDDVLRLTTAPDQSGVAWFAEKQRLGSGFETTFRFRLTPTDPPGFTQADGLAFVVQNAAADVFPNSKGGFIGYTGIPSSLAVEFDTYFNPGLDPDGNHVAVVTRGAEPNFPDHSGSLVNAIATPTVTLTDGAEHTVRIEYVPGTLRVFLDGSLLISAAVDLTSIGGSSILDSNGEAWVGFTAATGGGASHHDILSWSLSELATARCNGFCFLPPTPGITSAPSPSGTFDAGRNVTVLVCELNGASCAAGPYVAGFLSTFGRTRVQVDAADEAYFVNWNTRGFNLDSGQMYRIRVYSGGRELGHHDTLLTPGNRVQIRFRIENG